MTTTTFEAVRPDLVPGRGGGGPSSTRTVVAYGFWIFILSDITMFAALFAANAVLSERTAGGPTGSELINLRHVFIETMCLLVSSYTCGLGALSAERRQPDRFLIFNAFTLSRNCAARSNSNFRAASRIRSSSSAMNFSRCSGVMPAVLGPAGPVPFAPFRRLRFHAVGPRSSRTP